MKHYRLNGFCFASYNGRSRDGVLKRLSDQGVKPRKTRLIKEDPPSTQVFQTGNWELYFRLVEIHLGVTGNIRIREGFHRIKRVSR